MKNKLDKQKGMALLELLAAMAISSMIMGGAVALVFQEYHGTNIAKTHVIAAHEIGNAVRWISQDGTMAESTDLLDGAEAVDQVTLNWIERCDYANTPHSVGYYLTENQLKCNYDGVITTVARNIGSLKFSQTGRYLMVSVSCTPRWWNPTQTLQKDFRFYLRTAVEEQV